VRYGARSMPTPPSGDQPRVRSAEFVAGAKVEGEIPAPVMSEIAFVGRSNVGKSSLINALVQRKNLVRTSSTPGCTRQLSFFEIELTDDAKLMLVDLPGYGYAKRSKEERDQWADVIEAYLLGRSTLRAVVSIVDVRRGIEPDDRDLLQLVTEKPRVSRSPLTVILVATKLDKLPRSKQKLELERVKQAAGVPVLGFSAEDGTGREELWRRVRRAANLAT
jgi:GTP-binding protein